MKRKGFTLIELLAVIVILAVVALITVPAILGVIDKARRSSYKDSIYGIIESANIYLASNLSKINKNEEIVFTCNGVSCVNSEGEKLSFKGSVPKSGSFYLNGKGEVTVESVYNGRYYANTVGDDIEITDEDTTLTRAELTTLVKELQQEVRELKQQLNTKSDATQIATLTNQHNSDVTSIWNKVGTEDLSSISNGSISQILIDNNQLVSDLNELITSQGTTINNLQTTVNTKADSTTVNTLSSQLTTLSGTVNNHTTSINNLTTSLNNYLPLSGGTITGSLNLNKSLSIRDNTRDISSSTDWGIESNYVDKSGTRVSYSNAKFNGDGTADFYVGADKGNLRLTAWNGDIYLNSQKFNTTTTGIDNMNFYYNDYYDCFVLTINAESGDKLEIKFAKDTFEYKLNGTVIWNK